MRIINSRDIMETIEMLTARTSTCAPSQWASAAGLHRPGCGQGVRENLQQDHPSGGQFGLRRGRHQRRIRHPHRQQAHQRHAHCDAAGRRARRRPRAVRQNAGPRGQGVGVNFIGGFGALVHKGFSAGDKRLIAAIPRALAETDIVCSSVNIGSTKSGINMDAVKLMGEVVRETAELTKDNMCMGDAKLVVFCNAPEDNPFMAGAFHGAGEPDCEIHVASPAPVRCAPRWLSCRRTPRWTRWPSWLSARHSRSPPGPAGSEPRQ